MRRPREAGTPRAPGADPRVEVRDTLVYRTRADGVLTFANDAYCLALGRVREDVIGRSLWSFIPASEHARCQRHFAALTPDEPAGEIECLTHGPRGEPMRQRWSTFVRFNEAGEVIERVGIGKTVAGGRRRSHESLLKSVERMRAMLDVIPDLVFVMTIDGVFLDYRAPDAASVRHHPPEEFLGRHIQDVFPAPLAARLQASIDRTRSSGSLTTLDYTLTREDDERAFEARIVKCTPSILLVVIRDRTEGKLAAEALDRAEAEARDLHHELAMLGQVVTLGVLAGSLAHELNQSLMSTQTNAEAALQFLTARAPDLDEVRAALVDIGRSNRHAAQVIRRLLASLKQKGAAEHRLVDLNAITMEVGRAILRQMRSRGVAIELQLARQLPVVLGDRFQLQQVILNLLMNAADAVADNEPQHRHVSVRTERMADEVTLSVVDSGIGMAPEDVARAFEPFYTTKAHGMGLGLAICRTIITLHGGRIRAERNAGAGMTFAFTLKIAHADADRAMSGA